MIIIGVDGDCGGNKKMLFRIPSADNETMNKLKSNSNATDGTQISDLPKYEGTNLYYYAVYQAVPLIMFLISLSLSSLNAITSFETIWYWLSITGNLSRVASAYGDNMMHDNILTHEFTSNDVNALRRSSFVFRDTIPLQSVLSSIEHKEGDQGEYPESRV